MATEPNDLMTAAARASKVYAERQRDVGMTQIKIWVPKPLTGGFYKAAERARGMHRRGETAQRLYVEVRAVAP